ncbi:MAG: hypothetical protein KIT16_14050 [Rhodospirillaceae bacterium]|nr:hypothetical protein [Rhodospirillaceae bacterium]
MPKQDPPEKKMARKATAMAKTKIGRSAVSGKFITVKQAQSRPNTSVVETIKKGGGKKKGK